MSAPYAPPEVRDREDGLEVLLFHRGKWTHVRWSTTHGAWSLGYGGPLVMDGGRRFAPLPENTPAEHIDDPRGPQGFYGWKS